MDRRPRALLVDLNNFAAYPTLAIGYLVAALRQGDVDVRVLSPLHHGVKPTLREPPETYKEHVMRRIQHGSHPVMSRSYDLARAAWAARRHRADPRVLELTADALREQSIDVLLLSAYLDHYPSVKALARIAGERGIPVVLGGPMFNQPEVAREWLDLPGLTAVFGGEADYSVAEIVHAVVNRDGLADLPGVLHQDGGTLPAPPLGDLTRLPVPDFSDFPWAAYPQTVIPVMTGRGCGWGRCLFCSDVITSNGRGFRSRPPEAVLDEMVQQAERYGSRKFIFLDIKLNSDLPMWRTLLEQIPKRLPGATWVGTVHVQARGENGLTAEELEAARSAGMRRISFGLETGSQRINNKMAKGTKLELTSRFIRDAHHAGLSVRTSMMLGYPEETVDDVRSTIRYVREHEAQLDRICMSRFKAIPGTAFESRFTRRPERYSDLRNVRWNKRLARAHYENRATMGRPYRRAKADLLSIVHHLNARPLPHGADGFDGLM
jgi:anaerobic magnesium-protoporphyrin IX monomethyl ester cyclase